MNDLLKRLNLNEVSPLFDECYEKVSAETGIPHWLTEEFIKNAHSELGILPTQLDAVLQARTEVVKNEDLVMFARVLYEMLFVDAEGREIFKDLTFPQVA